MVRMLSAKKKAIPKESPEIKSPTTGTVCPFARKRDVLLPESDNVSLFPYRGAKVVTFSEKRAKAGNIIC